jgi:hypothetical protein
MLAFFLLLVVIDHIFLTLAYFILLVLVSLLVVVLTVLLIPLLGLGLTVVVLGVGGLLLVGEHGLELVVDVLDFGATEAVESFCAVVAFTLV